MYSEVIRTVPFGYEVETPFYKAAVKIVCVFGNHLCGGFGCSAGSKCILQTCRIENTAQGHSGLQNVVLAGRHVEYG